MLVVATVAMVIESILSTLLCDKKSIIRSCTDFTLNLKSSVLNLFFLYLADYRGVSMIFGAGFGWANLDGKSNLEGYV
jgi:hypothetical protein